MYHYNIEKVKKQASKATKFIQNFRLFAHISNFKRFIFTVKYMKNGLISTKFNNL